MDYQTKVKLYVADAPSEWIACAIVCLYDRDRISRDDHLGMDITDVYGEATFRFSEADFVDVDERLGGALPELYVKVFDSHGRCVISTRTRAARNSVPDLIRIPIERKLAESHDLI